MSDVQQRRAELEASLRALSDEAGDVSALRERSAAALSEVRRAAEQRPTWAELAAAVHRVRSLEALRDALALTALVSEKNKDDLSADEDFFALLAARRRKIGCTAASFPQSLRDAVARKCAVLCDAAFSAAAAALKAAGWPAAVALRRLTFDGGEDAEHPQTAFLPPAETTVSALRRAIIAEDALLAWTQQQQQQQQGEQEGLQLAERTVADELVAGPLRRRFAFHFCGGNRELQTAAPEKLRWALAFVLDVLKDGAPWLDGHVQPAFTAVSTKQRVATTLIAAVAEKIAADAAEMDDAAFLNAVTDCLWFDSQCDADAFGLGDNLSLLSQIARGDMLQRWVRAEWKAAAKTLDEATRTHGDGRAETWTPDPVDGVPMLGALAVDLVDSLTERFSPLSDAESRSQFLFQVQVPLLQRFMHEVSMARTKGIGDADIARHCTLSGACVHCEDALQRWQSDALSSGIGSVFNSILRQCVRLRKDLLARAAAIISESFAATIAPLLVSDSWGTEPATAPDAVLPADVSDTMAVALETLRRQLSVGKASLVVLTAGGNGELLFDKLLRRVAGSVSTTLISALTSFKKRNSTAAARAQARIDIETTLDVLSEFAKAADAERGRYFSPMSDTTSRMI